MLLAFISENKDELIRRTREKVRARSAPLATEQELQNGVPLFLQQFSELLAQTRLRHTELAREEPRMAALGNSATRHGNDLLRRGFTIAQVVHDYGDICQAVTELASEQSEQFDTGEFHLLNLCLDNAIAGAVTEYARQRDVDLAALETERLGFLAHELRNQLAAATMAFQALRGGTVGIGGNTGALLERSLAGLRGLVDRALADVRLASGQHKPARIIVAELIEEIEVSATLDAKSRGIALGVAPVDYGLAVEADRQLLSAAVSNLLQNAFKFTRPRGKVSLSARAERDRVLIEVEDECGGLPPGKAEELFRPFERRGDDQSGLGLGLTISRKSVAANGGEIQVKNLAGQGCVFTIDLPRAA